MKSDVDGGRMVANTVADWVALDLAEGAGGGARAWVIDAQGQVAAEGRLPRAGNGAAAPGGWEAGLRAWLEGCGVAGAPDVPVLAAGAHGLAAPRGIPCPPLPERLLPASGGQADGKRLFPVPGLLQASPPDLVHGAAARIAGWLAQAPAFDGVILCLQAGGSTWAHVSAGEVVSFQSFLSGEIFAALAPAGVDQGNLPEDPEFTEALAGAQARPERLAAHLAGARAALEAGQISPEAVRARLAAALIGAELAAARPYWLGRDLALIGAGPLAGAYEAALKAQGITPARMEEGTAVLAGLAVARGRLRPR
ncbi:2-dehydro-3-deoxygalactonokinase [Alkalilacustris brevis]|uniref:2-dehydro-3-deoxygalactonokinase n=1 Tax=Alkalilacustris brevis TaxID=2026338 RepID=UPI00138FEF6A|nr:2-dehydro-3-deoxygalactonokinase [Alkalilacustris brevis]